MHARPAMLFAELAQQHSVDITVRRVDQTESVDAKSIMQLMMLAATTGTELEISATGPGADEAVAQLADLVRSGFNE